MVRVVFRYDPDHSKGALGRVIEYREINALIDTGADLNYADPDLIKAVGSPAHGTTTVQGATSTISSTLHVAHLFFPSIGRQIETDVVATPLRANGRAYDLVLGSLFLQCGVLHMDFLTASFTFAFGDPG